MQIKAVSLLQRDIASDRREPGNNARKEETTHRESFRAVLDEVMRKEVSLCRKSTTDETLFTTGQKFR